MHQFLSAQWSPGTCTSSRQPFCNPAKTMWLCVLQDGSSFSGTHLPAHSTDHSGFPEPISSHSYQPLAQSESQNLPSQHPPQASIPSSEPSFFPSMGSQAPAQHAGGMGGLGDGMTNGFGSLSGLSDAQHGGGSLLNGAPDYSLGPDPSSIPQPGQSNHHTSLAVRCHLPRLRCTDIALRSLESLTINNAAIFWKGISHHSCIGRCLPKSKK